jgi:hypothetical protein
MIRSNGSFENTEHGGDVALMEEPEIQGGRCKSMKRKIDVERDGIALHVERVGPLVLNSENERLPHVVIPLHSDLCSM